MILYSQNIWNHNPSEYRNSLVYSMVLQTGADICMFQECGPATNRVGATAISELMKYEYTEVCPEKASMNFTPVYYKTDKFNLIDSGYYLYTGLNDANSKSVTWAVLEDAETAKCFAAISTHFWWKYDSNVDNQQRIQNARELKDICDQIIEKYAVPVLIGGDFNNGENSEQGDEPYKAMLQMGFKDLRLMSLNTTDTFTHHEYPVLKENGIYAEGSLPNKTIDYIFAYGKEPKELTRFDILTTQKALDSSDHCPLISEVIL